MWITAEINQRLFWTRRNNNNNLKYYKFFMIFLHIKKKE